MDQVPVDPSILDTIPAIPAPAGVTPNFENPYSIAPAGRIVLGILFPFMIIGIASRLYTRLWITRSIGADDYLAVAATASVVAYFAVTMSVLGSPLGPHMWNVPLSAITPKFIEGVIVVADLYSASAMLLKSSLLILYLRLFRTNKTMRIMIWVGIVLVVIVYSACIIATSIFCRSSQWPKAISAPEFLILQSQSNCNRPQLNLAAAQGVFSTASDIYVLVLPVNLIWHLRLSRRRRVGICAILLTGFLATACSIGTLYTRFSQRGSIDFTWDSTLNIVLGGVELQVGVVCNCMPVSFIIFKRAGAASWTSIRRYLSSRRRGGGSSYDIDNGGAGSNELKAGPESSTIDNGNPGRLPKLPRIHLGNWTGFRTLLSRRDNHAGATTELRTYGELNSVDEDYHAQLKRAWGSPPPPSHPRTSDSVSVPGAAV